jgi:hypothetical protein
MLTWMGRKSWIRCGIHQGPAFEVILCQWWLAVESQDAVRTLKLGRFSFQLWFKKMSCWCSWEIHLWGQTLKTGHTVYHMQWIENLPIISHLPGPEHVIRESLWGVNPGVWFALLRRLVSTQQVREDTGSEPVWGGAILGSQSPVHSLSPSYCLAAPSFHLFSAEEICRLGICGFRKN